MKKTALSLLCILALCFCACDGTKEQSTDAAAETETQDSLRTAIAEKDSLLSLLAAVNNGMNEIKELEKLISVANLNSETPSRKQQLMNDMTLIKQALADRRKRLEALESRLSKSQNYSDEMKKTVESLKAQITQQEATIADLQKQLYTAKVTIADLNEDVDSLVTQNAQITKEKAAAEEESERLTNALNTCYYVVGSKKELKDNNIIKTGFLRKTKVMESDYELSYFTRADKRTLTELPLHSKKAKVLSKHPEGTYRIDEEPETKAKTLVILDTTRFWELSNFLIVQIN